MRTIPIALPDDLAQELAGAGLLNPEAMEDALRERLRAVRLAYLDEVLAKANADADEPMTNDEINAEVAAYRAGKRRAAGS